METTGLIEKKIRISDAHLAYYDVGRGQTFLFIHGNPTSKFIWREIIPEVSKIGRVVAIDSLGMGNSDKVPNSFTFDQQYTYLEKFIDELGLQNIILVLHDWGGALGLNYAKKHSDRVAGLIAMEILYNPIISLRQSGPLPWLLFKTLKLPWLGRKLLVEKNIFIEFLIQLGTIKRLSKNVIDQYRKPFLLLEDRRSIQSWVDEIPYKGHGLKNLEILKTNEEYFRTSQKPKLLFHAWPGFAIPPRLVRKMKKNVSNLDSVHLGLGLHFVQEDHSKKIASAICQWHSNNKERLRDNSLPVS